MPNFKIFYQVKIVKEILVGPSNIVVDSGGLAVKKVANYTNNFFLYLCEIFIKQIHGALIPMESIYCPT